MNIEKTLFALLLLLSTLMTAQTVVVDTLWVDDFSSDSIDVSVFPDAVNKYNGYIDTVGWHGNGKVLVMDVHSSDEFRFSFNLSLNTSVQYDSIVMRVRADHMNVKVENPDKSSYTYFLSNPPKEYTASLKVTSYAIVGRSDVLCTNCSQFSHNGTVSLKANVYGIAYDKFNDVSGNYSSDWYKNYEIRDNQNLSSVNYQMRDDFCLECATVYGSPGPMNNNVYYDCLNSSSTPDLGYMNNQGMIHKIEIHGYRTELSTNSDEVKLFKENMNIVQLYDLLGREVTINQALNRIVIAQYESGKKELIYYNRVSH